MDLFIRNHFQQNSNPNKATHFHNITKSYLDIPLESQNEFWVNYCESVSNGHNPYVCELVNSRESMQLAYKIKFVFERQQIPTRNDVLIELIDSIDTYVRHIIGVIQSMISYYFESSQQCHEYIACYLRRDISSTLIWKTNTVEYEGKIIFPYAHIRKEYISKFYHFIINQLQLRSDTPDEYLTISPINSFDTLILPVNEQNLELYGSSINDNTPPLKLYECYGFLNTDLKTTFNDISTIFIPTLHSAVAQIGMNVITEKIQEKGMQYWLPLFFSSDFYDVPLKAKEGMSLTNIELPTITMNVVRENGETLTKLERARQILNLISVRRVEEYWSWYDIGTALHSVDPSEEGLRLWKWFTTQSDFKSEEDCEQLWYTFEVSKDVDIESLEYLAGVDNLDKYNSFREAEIDEAINKAINLQEHTPIAKAFKACFPHTFVCSNFDAGEWYYYNGFRWVSMNGTSDLMWYINEKFQHILEKKQSEIADKIARSRDPEFKVRNQNRMTAIGQLIAKLSKNGFKEGLCKELKIYYKKENFNRLKDLVPEFMATPSGVIDLRGGIPIVRQGKPQDYITKCTRYPYPHTYTWETKAVKDTMEYLRKVFRSKTLRDFILRFGASLLLSGNNNKIFPIFSGEGNNSKSIFVRIIECAFGSYAVKLPTSLITEKRTSADSATPTLIHSQGAKVAFLQEPNSRDVIQSGTVKELTGGVDTLYVRDLFQKGSKIIEMDVTITPILIANKIPVIPDCQQAIWNRTRVVKFNSTWDSNAPLSEEEQMQTGIFKLDKFFDQKIPMMAPALLWIFVQIYGSEEYRRDGLNEPAEVLEATENFRVANNYYIHFTRDCVKPVLDNNGIIDTSIPCSLDELFNTFRKWYTDQQFRAKMPNKTEFKENLEIIWKQKADPEHKWYGIRLNTQANTIQSLLSY
jgi:phage/plasmid-associated DNA primase